MGTHAANTNARARRARRARTHPRASLKHPPARTPARFDPTRRVFRPSPILAAAAPQVLYAGLFVRVDQIPPWIRWGQYLCSLKYGINLFLANEFGAATCDPARRSQCAGLLASSDADEGIWWAYVLVLLGIFLAFRLAGLVVLARKARGFALA